MSMSCWIGMRRPLPTPGTPLDFPPPPGTLSATASLASLSLPAFASGPAASLAASLALPAAPLTPLTTLPAPLTASGVSAASPTPAATPFGMGGAPLPERFFAPWDSDCAASRATRPMAVPTVSATSCAISPSPTSGYFPYEADAPDRRDGNTGVAGGRRRESPGATDRKNDCLAPGQ